jgi:hypothetical protein
MEVRIMSAFETSAAPLLLTLRFDAVSFERLNALRKQHFPASRNHIPAHLTLFHALPADREAYIREVVAGAVAKTPVLALRFGALRFLGRGVAIDVECEELLRLRGELRRAFASFLTPQDAQNWKHPHVTIQNKVTSQVARSTFDDLNEDWQQWEGQAEGLLLWYYRGGPWEKAGDFDFPVSTSL